MKVLKPQGWWWMGTMAMMVLVAWTLAGCASNQSNPPPSPFGQQSQSGASEQQQSQPAQAPQTSSGQRPMFYDFQDIPVPSELDLVSGDSYVFQSGSFKAGLLTLRGRVDINSLISFFQMAMPRENWKAKGGFRYRRSVLIFEKPDKICMINLYEKTFYTYAEIYVAPATGQF